MPPNDLLDFRTGQPAESTNLPASVPGPDPLQLIPGDKLDLARKAGWSDDEIRKWVVNRGQEQLGKDRGELPKRDVNWEGVDISTGAPAWDRFQAGFKSGPEGRLNFYKKRFGPENVRTSPGGEIEFMNPSTKTWTRADEEGLSVKDLADLGGDLPELAGMMLAPALRSVQGIKALLSASKPLRYATTMGAGAGLGNVAKQTVGQMLPGDESISISDPLKAAAGAEAVSLYNRLSPTLNAAKLVGNSQQFVEDYIKRRLSNPETLARVREGLELSQKTGVPLNLAEITGDPVLKTFLGFAHRSGAGQPLAMQEAAAKQSAALARFQRIMGELAGPRGFENPSFGEAASVAARNTLADIQKGLDESGMKQLLSAPESEVTNIPLTNRKAYLQQLTDYYKSMDPSRGGPPGMENIGQELSKLAQTPYGMGLGNARLVQHLLQDSGQSGFGALPEKEFPRLAAMAGTKESRDLWEATRKDLEAAAQTNPVAKRLLDARSKTGELLSLREGVEQVPLLAFMNSKGMLGPAMKGGVAPGADKILPTLLQGMQNGAISPGEMSNMMKVLTVANPRFADQFAHETLAQAVKAGMTEKGFDYQKAVKALPDMRYLESIYKDVWTPGQKASGVKMYSDLDMLMKALQRVEKFGLGIPQSPATQALGIGHRVLSGDVGGAARQTVSNFVIPQVIARLSFNPEVRQQLLDYVTKGGQEKAPTFMASFLKNTLPALLYEGGSVMQQRNQSGYGGTQQ